ncbi:lymphocyte antigen 86-like [Ahaetulla prasina]|uniref:lymphocyte antigen 86-like n=1 Tax=Ahaetulla prasina TaxID=499056 RepID=UPI00264A435C|nr:lymphocyte antigen 86-like [Ahaetulla prasina]
MRLATVLRHSINELFLDISLIDPRHIIPLHRKQLCEQNQPPFPFCGKKKGDYIYYAGPAFMMFGNIPSIELHVKGQLFNEDHRTIICVDFYINKK